MMSQAWIAIAIATTLAGCGSKSPGDGTAEDTASTDATSSTGESTEAVDQDTTTDGTPSFPSPDCDTVVLPGDPADVAATPRADRDAEILALMLAPELMVARQDRYELIAADLQSIREQRPELADVHVSCVIPTGYEFWADFGIIDVVWLGNYHAWDCHNAFYGIEYAGVGGGGDVWRIDGLGFAMRVYGVYDPDTFIDLYEALPWGPVEYYPPQLDPYWDFPNDNDCEPTEGQLTLSADAATIDALGERSYTFEHPELGTAVFVATGTEPPVPAA